MVRIAILIGLLLHVELWALDREVGAYSRKSVSFVDAVWLLDQSVRNMPAGSIKPLLSKIHANLKLGRFDYNPIPENYLNDFINAANSVNLGSGDKSLEILSSLLEENVVPKIAEALEVNKELRAANLLTEQQKNSFISDKAKLLGITEAELKNVMNAAYIYLPVIKNYSHQRSDQKVSVSLDVGIIWFKLDETEGGLKAKSIIKEWTTTSSTASENDLLIGYRNASEYAFAKVAEQAAKNLKVATQAYADFKLTGQVMSVDNSSVSFDLGKGEGVTVNNTYLLVEKFQNEDGEITEEEAGWVIIDEVMTESELGSSGQLISGNPDIGVEVREYPLMSTELLFGLRYNQFELDNDYYKIRGSYALDLAALYQIGEGFQNYLEFGLTAGIIDFENKESEIKSDSSLVNGLMGGIRIGYSKRMHIYKRLALRIALGGQVNSVYLNLYGKIAGEDSESIYTYDFGFFSKSAIELALSPQWKMGVFGEWVLAPKNEEWFDKSDLGLKYDAIDWSKLSVGLYFSYNPKSLAFDPLDLVISNLKR